jgi:parathyroid hormone receptor 1
MTRCCRKLRCPRNTVHVNLFISFILRAGVCFLREALVVNGVGLAHDVVADANGTVVFRTDIAVR